MRVFFEPADAPTWLKRALSSIRASLSDIWPTPIRLKDYATASLPPAADWKQGAVYDSTLPALKYSDGTNWVRLSDYDADVAAIAALSTTGLIARTGAGTAATRTITGPAAGITVTNGDGVSGNPTLALANDLAALEALSGTSTIYYRSGADTWSAVTIGGNLGFSAGTLGSSLGTAATKNTGTSGDAVPVLNGAATTWANGATFGGTLNVTGLVDATSTIVARNGILQADTTAGNAAFFRMSVSGTVAGYVALGGDGSTIFWNTQSATGQHTFEIGAVQPLIITSSAVNLGSSIALQLNGTTVIDSSRNGSFVALSCSGNATLGDASTDSHTINGNAASTGSIKSSSATAGIGYASGARGTVTQLTNKSTGVTSNTVVTDITLNGAALASATTVSFTFTNSAIAANDALILNHVTTGTFGGYNLNAHNFAAGSCVIDVRNLTGGSLSEAIVIRAVLMKGG